MHRAPRQLNLGMSAVLLLVMLVGGASSALECDHPVITSHAMRLSGLDQRLRSLTSQLDNIRLRFDYDEESVVEEDEWTMEFDYKTIGCLALEDDLASQFDEADENLLSREARPEDGYFLYEHVGALKLHSHPLDWEFAQPVCDREGGRLVVVDTMRKVLAVQDLLQKHPAVVRASILGNQVLVGINDMQEEGVFRTSTGEEFKPWNKSVWFPNEPDDALPGEDCVTFHITGRIRDVPCFYEMPFVCEKYYT